MAENLGVVRADVVSLAPSVGATLAYGFVRFLNRPHLGAHSNASHAIAGGMPIEIAQQNLGHASLATTTVYVTTEQKRRMKAVESFWSRWARAKHWGGHLGEPGRPLWHPGTGASGTQRASDHPPERALRNVTITSIVTIPSTNLW